MKFIYLDCIGGASGDMLLGAFLDGLVPFEHLQTEIKKTGLSGYELLLDETQRHFISAKKFSVKSHEHAHRHLSDIEKLIKNSGLNDWIKVKSIEVFRHLGEQEAKIHQIPINKVHFHEVGAVDSIIDIIGTFICLDYLKPDKVFASALPLSEGFVKAAHGNLPLPAPATLELLKDYPVKYLPIEGELVTPTGAALLVDISEGLLPAQQSLKISSIGYGAGSKEWEEIPNLLRIWQGKFSDDFTYDTIFQIETNIDDMNPEFFPYLQELLLKSGALDVILYQGIMKKGRPGMLVSILADAHKLDTVRNILYSQSTTIGFRYFPVYREKLKREIKIVDSPWGKIRVKKVVWNKEERLLPEYEVCQKIAKEKNIPLQKIFQELQIFLSNKKVKSE
jgi:uncharacterized protein (TIGR00299 family) protein